MRFPRVLSASAACREADPGLFNWSSNSEVVLLALSYCDRCLVRKQCLDFVKPGRSLFDGVVGGSLWRNGRKVERPADATATIDWSDDESPPDVRDNGA